MAIQSTIEFPRWVFSCPGSLSRPGGTFSHKLAHDMDEAAQLLATGWYPTLPEAVEAFQAQSEQLRSYPPPPPPAVAQAPAEVPAIGDDSLMPTRAEIESKMTELGLRMDKRKSDATLLAEIDLALRRKGKS